MPNLANLSAILFHFIVCFFIYVSVGIPEVIFYGLSASVATIIVHVLVYEKYYVRKWPNGFYGGTTVSRLTSEPVMASANVIFTKVCMVAGNSFFWLAENWFKVETHLHKPKENYYDSLKPLHLGLVEPEKITILSDFNFWIANQLTSVLGWNALLFTIFSIVGILLIELGFVELYAKNKGRRFLEVLKG